MTFQFIYEGGVQKQKQHFIRKKGIVPNIHKYDKIRYIEPISLVKFANLIAQVSIIFLTVVVGLTAARTLLERFRSKIYDFNTLITPVSRHSGT